MASALPFIAGRGDSSLHHLTNPWKGIESGGEPNTSSNKNVQVLEANEEDYEKLFGKKKFNLQQLLIEENLRLTGLSPTNFLGESFSYYRFPSHIFKNHG